MNNELEKRLFDEFPTVFRQRMFPLSESAMCWGMDCGDGWFDLIYDLAKKIEEYNQTQDENDRIEATQVKEKFAGLRFYTNYSIDEIDEHIDKAEHDSLTICEMCGKEGQGTVIYGWIKTLCPQHIEELSNR